MVEKIGGFLFFRLYDLCFLISVLNPNRVFSLNSRELRYLVKNTCSSQRLQLQF